MASVKERAASEMTIDQRTEEELQAARHNSDLFSLNPQFNVFKSEPHLIARLHQGEAKTAVFHLEAQQLMLCVGRRLTLLQG